MIRIKAQFQSFICFFTDRFWIWCLVIIGVDRYLHNKLELSWFGSLRLLSGLAGWSFEDVRDNGGQVVHSLFNLKINNFVIKKGAYKNWSKLFSRCHLFNSGRLYNKVMMIWPKIQLIQIFNKYTVNCGNITIKLIIILLS